MSSGTLPRTDVLDRLQYCCELVRVAVECRRAAIELNSTPASAELRDLAELAARYAARMGTRAFRKERPHGDEAF